jgi:putative transposase
LRHQVIVWRRQRPHWLRLLSVDRLLWVWLYRLGRRFSKPWYSFIYWRWRSRCPGRPKTSDQIRELIRRMSLDNPLWGAPRVRGELLKLGIEVSQATVGGYLPRRPKAPAPTWRSFLRNHMTDIACSFCYPKIISLDPHRQTDSETKHILSKDKANGRFFRRVGDLLPNTA